MAVNARLTRLKKDRKVILNQITKLVRELAEVELDIDDLEKPPVKVAPVKAKPAPRKRK